MSNNKATDTPQPANTVPSTDRSDLPEAPPPAYDQEEYPVPLGGSTPASSSRQVESQPLLLAQNQPNDGQAKQQDRAPDIRLSWRGNTGISAEGVVAQGSATSDQGNGARETEVPQSDRWDQPTNESKVKNRRPSKRNCLIAVAVILIIFLAVFLPVLFGVVRKKLDDDGNHVQSPLAGWNAVGCYNDTGNPRTLLAASYSSTLMTPAACLAYGANKSYSYCGVEDGNQCYCGYSIQSSAIPENGKDCNTTCAGDSAQTCGGAWKMFIYAHGQPVVPVNKRLVNGLQYNGCYTDNNTTSRALNGYFLNDQLMTVEMCTAACASNYKLAGLEYGTQCFCGNSFEPWVKKVDDGQCGQTCQGDSTEFCGRDLYLTVYGASS